MRTTLSIFLLSILLFVSALLTSKKAPDVGEQVHERSAKVFVSKMTPLCNTSDDQVPLSLIAHTEIPLEIAAHSKQLTLGERTLPTTGDDSNFMFHQRSEQEDWISGELVIGRRTSVGFELEYKYMRCASNDTACGASACEIVAYIWSP